MIAYFSGLIHVFKVNLLTTGLINYYVSLVVLLFTVVSSVLQKAPLLFNKKQIHVEEVRMDGEKMEKEAEGEAEDEAAGPRCTIEVRGMKESTSKDSVELYFDNKRKSGGGEVEEVKGEVEDGVLYVTFENEESKWRFSTRRY